VQCLFLKAQEGKGQGKEKERGGYSSPYSSCSLGRRLPSHTGHGIRLGGGKKEGGEGKKALSFQCPSVPSFLFSSSSEGEKGGEEEKKGKGWGGGGGGGGGVERSFLPPPYFPIVHLSLFPCSIL